MVIPARVAMLALLQLLMLHLLLVVITSLCNRSSHRCSTRVHLHVARVLLRHLVLVVCMGMAMHLPMGMAGYLGV